MTLSLISGLHSGYDYSADFHKIRSGIRAKDGTSYTDFLAQLKPRYAIVWRDITFGYAALLSTCLLIAVARGHGAMTWLAAMGGAVSIGFWIAYLQLFMHEAAHFNVAETRKRNDLLANLWVCAIGGQEVSRYRRVHFQHHRALGRPDDSEQTYSQALTPGLLLKTLTGIRSLEVASGRHHQLSGSQERGHETGYLSKWLVLTFLIHSGVVSAAFYWGFYALALAWIVGAGVFFPCFGALRNLLEHRPGAGEEPAEQDRHAVTRIFGDGPFSSTFGGAGFNRHLLHHWEPQASYTNLKELEQFLLATPLREILESRRTSYWHALVQLFQWKNA